MLAGDRIFGGNSRWFCATDNELKNCSKEKFLFEGVTSSFSFSRTTPSISLFSFQPEIKNILTSTLLSDLNRPHWGHLSMSPILPKWLKMRHECFALFIFDVKCNFWLNWSFVTHLFWSILWYNQDLGWLNVFKLDHKLNAPLTDLT